MIAALRTFLSGGPPLEIPVDKAPPARDYDLEDTSTRSRPPRRRSSARRDFGAADSGRLNSTWSTVPRSIEDLIRLHRTTLVARSRHQFRSNDYVRGFVRLLQDNVIGPRGFDLQSAATYPDGTPDELAARALERNWAAWTRPRNCDAKQRQSFVEILRTYEQSICVDGEAFFRFHYGEAFGDYGFAVELLDSVACPADLDKTLPNGNEIRAGIEYDARDRAAAYWFTVRNKPEGGAALYHHGKPLVRVDASEILHDYLTEEAGQRRGLPWLSTSLQRLRMLDGYLEAALVAARVGAAKVGMISKPGDGEQWGEGEDEDGAPTVTAEPGEFETLPPGWKLESWSPEYPRGEFSDFVKRCLQGIAAGGGLQYFAIAKDHGDENYSSMMAGRIEDRDVYEALQERTIVHVLEPIFDRFLRAALISGRLTIAGETAFAAARYEKLRAVVWRGKRWRSIDPVKDATARKIEVDNGFRSRSSVIRDSGDDPARVYAEIAADRDKLAELGIVLQAAPLATVPPEDPPAADPPTDESTQPNEEAA